MFRSIAKPVYYKPTNEIYLGLVAFIIIGGLAVIGLKMMEKDVGLYPLYLLSLVQLSPILISAARRKFNYISFVLFNHFFSYSLTKLNQLSILQHIETIPPEGLLAIRELTICSLLIALGYYTTRFFLPSKRSSEPYQLLSLKRWQLILVAGYVILVPFFMQYLPTWYLAIHFTILGADMMLLLSSNSPGHERLATLMKIGVFLSTLWFFIYTGMLTLVGVLAAYIFIAACIRKKLTYFIFPILLTILGSSIQSVKFDYRRAILANPSATAMERIATLTGLLELKFTNGPQDLTENLDIEDGAEDKLLNGFQRLGDDSLERVLDWTPKKVPFWNGETYAHLPFMFIPRVLWPDKPSRHLWHKFGHVYGYLSEDDNQTSVGVTYLAEAYMNFGFAGLYSVAFGFGCFVWMVEMMSYMILRGNFAFSFMIFLIPLQWYASDLGTIINSVVIMTAILVLFRNQVLNMARTDAYSDVPQTT